MRTRRPSSSRSPQAPTHWPELVRTEARWQWEDLRDWVEDLIRRFRFDSRTIPPCWYRHNGMVEALSALYDYELACFGLSESKRSAVDWLRALNDIELLLRGWASRSGCTVNQHRDDPDAAIRVDEADWARFTGADAERRGAIPLALALDDE
jgi:hypothetical protein